MKRPTTRPPRGIPMFQPDQYQLIDFGEGRKLERFGPFVLDRPAPAAENSPMRHRGRWSAAHARFERAGDDRGRWHPADALPESWEIQHGRLTLGLKPTEFGHVGVFAEQADNWDWLERTIRRRQPPVRLLNLFAYTGGSTLAAAAAGAEVVHVDAARNVVGWARRNAERSELGDAPVRWIVEDARKFVRRELKRGNRYDAIVLDPPSYGHGPDGQTWKLQRHLLPLLRDCMELTDGKCRAMLLTCHTPTFGPAEVGAMLTDAMFGSCAVEVVARPLTLTTSAGRRLPSGVVARWPA